MSIKHKKFHLFVLCLIAAITNGYVFNYLNVKYFHYSSNENGLSEYSKNWKIIMIIIVVPIVETLVFNIIPNKVLKKFGVESTFILVIIPSIFFSIFHFYHPIYGMMALFGGIIMNYYFLHSHNNLKTAFLLAALLHSSYNLYGYLFVN
ncbi:MAG: CPBP family intramembrane metalloprotease [Sphingobacteriia bacterium]|nr:MAG: CPBP family intramembrane metalloprotease [Sphingobacteriia bacterium]TAH08204.1 MAG: CPBP family intramembrane metalloprotease [Sphingobacteriia bacterium]